MVDVQVAVRMAAEVPFFESNNNDHMFTSFATLCCGRIHSDARRVGAPRAYCFIFGVVERRHF
jgi:hypothetical protein